jgi:hypothetical protein
MNEERVDEGSGWNLNPVPNYLDFPCGQVCRTGTTFSDGSDVDMTHRLLGEAWRQIRGPGGSAKTNTPFPPAALAPPTAATIATYCLPSLP